mgnify:FL=1
MTERKLQRNRRGFTLTEVLLALAILIILLALAMIPMLAIYLIFQKQFIEGIATSGGKL